MHETDMGCVSVHPVKFNATNFDCNTSFSAYNVGRNDLRIYTHPQSFPGYRSELGPM